MSLSTLSSTQGKPSRISKISLAHEDRIWCLAWNKQGTLLASSSTDKKVKIWSLTEQNQLQCQVCALSCDFLTPIVEHFRRRPHQNHQVDIVAPQRQPAGERQFRWDCLGVG